MKRNGVDLGSTRVQYHDPDPEQPDRLYESAWETVEPQHPHLSYELRALTDARYEGRWEE